MKADSLKTIIGSLLLAGLLAASGCYTVLMHPSVLTSSEREDTPQVYSGSGGDFTSEISYNQNCLNCHSQAELDDRYYDMGQVGMHFAHGMSIDPYGWRRPTTSIPWWDGVLAPIPPAALIPTSSTTDSGPRRRSSGVTRGDDGTRTAAAPSASAPTTTTTTTTTTAPTPSTAISDTRSSAPTSTPATSTDRARTASTPPQEPPTRKSGSTRGADPK